MKNYLFMLATDQRNGSGDKFVKGVLRVLSWIFLMIVGIRNKLYDIGLLRSHSLSVPVISVGNLTLGGVGKTPLVIYLAKILVEKGLKPVVLIRGYKETALGSDEVHVIRSKVKDLDVLQGADRLKNAREYLKYNRCDCFILDDGFQHRKIKRDLDIVAIDGLNPFGNTALLPRGILRESITSLNRADMVLLTRTDIAAEKISQLTSMIKSSGIDKAMVHTVHRPDVCTEIFNGKICDLDEIRDKRIVGFCGIGNPVGFKHTLLSLGVNLHEFISFDDHHQYVQEELDDLITKAEEHQCHYLVTTAKDAVKLNKLKMRQSEILKIVQLDVSIELTYGNENFKKRINSLLQH